MGESLRVTIVCEPDEDGPIVGSVPEVHRAHGQGRRTREETSGERNRRKAEAMHSA